MSHKETIRLQELGKLKAKYTSGPEVNESDYYDPHEHRNIPHPTTNAETLIHMLKGSFGTGILAMPEAFKNSGLTVGFIFTLLIGALCTYGLHILVQAQYILCKRMKVPLLTYPDSMKAALLSGPRCLQPLANASPILVDVFLIIYQLGICCVYVIFCALNLERILKDYLKDATIEHYTLMLFIPFMLIILVPNLKYLAPFSLVSNLITFVCFGIILYYIFTGLPPIGNLPQAGTLYAFPLFFGTTLFALEAVGVVIALENNMKTPKSFGGLFGVLNVAMFFITLSYVGMGFLGYWRYGDKTESSITLNIGDGKSVVAKVVQGLYSLAIFISYGLQGFIPVDIMWNTYLVHIFKDFKHPKVWEYLLRLVTVVVTFILAISIPLLNLFISLFGAFCLSALGIAFPAIMDICVRWPDDFGFGRWVLIKNYFLIIIGICGLLAGSYSSLSEIIRSLSK